MNLLLTSVNPAAQLRPSSDRRQFKHQDRLSSDQDEMSQRIESAIDQTITSSFFSPPDFFFDFRRSCSAASSKINRHETVPRKGAQPLRDDRWDYGPRLRLSGLGVDHSRQARRQRPGLFPLFLWSWHPQTERKPFRLWFEFFLFGLAACFLYPSVMCTVAPATASHTAQISEAVIVSKR